MLSFDFLGKSLGIVSPSHFVYTFSRKMFLILHSVNPNLGGLFRGLFWGIGGGGGSKITPLPRLKFVRIMLQSWN